MEKQLKNVA